MSVYCKGVNNPLRSRRIAKRLHLKNPTGRGVAPRQVADATLPQHQVNQLIHQTKDAGLRGVLPVHTDCRQTWPGDCETSHDIKVDARKLQNKNTATLHGALPRFKCLVTGFPAILLINGYTECLSRALCDFGWLLRPLAMEPKTRGAFWKL